MSETEKDRREASGETPVTAGDRWEALGCCLPGALGGLACVVVGWQSGTEGGAALLFLGLFILLVHLIPILGTLSSENGTTKR
jgi:hypothetical protein